MTQTKPTKTQLLAKKSNYLKLEFDYNKSIVLPFEEGMTLLSTFKLAESFDQSDYQNPVIVDLQEHTAPKIEVLNQTEYMNYKMAAILGVNPNKEEKEDEPF